MRPLLVTGTTAEEVAPVVTALVACGVARDQVEVLLPETAGETRQRVRRARGLVLGGGGDLHPRHFGEAELAGGGLSLVEDRDRLDLEALAGARQGQIPVWGICRGAQVLNVFFGGDLWQDLPSQLGGILPHDVSRPLDALSHGLEISAPESETGRILRREPPLVNSRHHQAIRKLGADLEAIAHSPDGVIEAIELNDDRWWVRAVQWHPEDLVALAQQRALWSTFLAAAA
ncbi:MAG: gamma-glutamyl-gamma-aminobutyrate hydrolase family protein [Acidobacteriota bacterium]